MDPAYVLEKRPDIVERNRSSDNAGIKNNLCLSGLLPQRFDVVPDNHVGQAADLFEVFQRVMIG